MYRDPTHDMLQLVPCVGRTVDKRAVGIQLNGLLVANCSVFNITEEDSSSIRVDNFPSHL